MFHVIFQSSRARNVTPIFSLFNYIVHENQPTLDSNTTPTRMFLRRRIVLLTLALIIAIVIITMTIVGLLISSYNERYININIHQEKPEIVSSFFIFLKILLYFKNKNVFKLFAVNRQKRKLEKARKLTLT